MKGRQMKSNPSRFVREAKKILELGLPMVATQLFIMGMGFVDTVMAGRYSTTDLAGVALGGNLLWPVFLFMSGITMALTPILAQLRGAKRLEGSGEKVRQGLWIAITAAVVTIIIVLMAEPLYIWMGVDREVIRVAMDYLYACAWGLPPLLVYVTLRFTAEGLGHTKPPMVIAACALALNIPLNYTFIYGKFGMPELGGVGCGVASAIVFWFELMMMLYVVRLPFFKQTGFSEKFSLPDFKGIKEIFTIGLPIATTAFVEMMVYSIISFLIAGIGVHEFAAHSIAGNLNWLTYVIPMSLGSAVSIRVGFAVGALDVEAARHVIRTTLSITVIYALVVTCLLIVSRHLLVSIYTKDPAVLGIAATLMLFIAFYQIVDALQATTIGALRGFKDTLVPMIISLVSYWCISLPLGYLLAEGRLFTPALGIYGYWAAMSFGLLLTAICVGIRLRMTSRRILGGLSSNEGRPAKL